MVVIPVFIPLGGAKKILNITSRRTMQDLLTRRIIPHLRLGSNRSRLLPEDYVLGLARYLRGRSITTPLVREFNATEEGRRLMADTKTRLQDAINVRQKHTSEEVAEIFGVERNTVGDWILDGVLQAEVEPRKGMVVDDDNPLSQKYAIKATTLRKFAVWVTPS